MAFAEGALTGTVAFTIPAVNAGGEPMTGDVDYAVIADDTDTLVTGTAAAGSRVEETVTLTGGKHKLTIVLSNEHGNGKSVNVQTEWVGLDVPYSPDNVELAIDVCDKLGWNLKIQPIEKENVYISTPSVLNQNGVRELVIFPLNEEEDKKLKTSMSVIRNSIDEILKAD